jgi:hypothetical protein
MKNSRVGRDAALLFIASAIISYFLPWATFSVWIYRLLLILGLVFFLIGLVRLRTNRPFGIRLIAVSLGPFAVWLILWLMKQNGLLP